MHSGPIARPIVPTKDLRRLWRGLSFKSPARRGYSSESSDDCSKEQLLPTESSEGVKLCRNLTEVPKGFLAVYVGPETKRYVIPASYLSSPDFRVLMEKVAEEFGFEQEGGLRFPCDEDDFEEILIRCFAKEGKRKKKDRDNVW